MSAIKTTSGRHWSRASLTMLWTRSRCDWSWSSASQSWLASSSLRWPACRRTGWRMEARSPGLRPVRKVITFSASFVSSNSRLCLLAGTDLAWEISIEDCKVLSAGLTCSHSPAQMFPSVLILQLRPLALSQSRGECHLTKSASTLPGLAAWREQQ